MKNIQKFDEYKVNKLELQQLKGGSDGEYDLPEITGVFYARRKARRVGVALRRRRSNG